MPLPARIQCFCHISISFFNIPQQRTNGYSFSFKDIVFSIDYLRIDFLFRWQNLQRFSNVNEFAGFGFRL